MMHSFLVTLGVGVLVFAATNADDLLLLLAFYSDRTFRGRYIVAGHCVGIATLTAVSVVAVLVAWTVPRADLGLLGLIPFALGLTKLLIRPTDCPETLPRRLVRAGSKVLTVAGTTLATGADNLAVNIPLFATRSPREVSLLVIVFLLMAGAWCGFAYALVRRHVAGQPVRRIGQRLLPWALMSVGVYVLAESRALFLFHH